MTRRDADPEGDPGELDALFAAYRDTRDRAVRNELVERWQSLAQSITVAAPATVTADDIRRALDAVIARHEALRLRVTSTVPGVWSVQPVAVQSFDTTDILTVHQITDPTPEAFARIAADTHARLDPTTHGTITAAAVFADGEHVSLVLVTHHLAVDAVSWRILLDALAAAADAVAADVDAADKPPALPSPAVPYSRYADAMSELAAAPSTMAELTRWRTLLARSVPITDARDFGVQADLITTAITLDEEHTRRYLSAESVTAAVIADSGSAITAWRTGDPRPAVSSLNARAGEVTPNLVLSRLDAQKRFTIRNNSGTTDVVVDLVGLVTTSNASRVGLIPPVRLLDTRTAGPITAGGTRQVLATAAPGVPDDVDAVLVTVTLVAPTEATHLTVWKYGTPTPSVSTVNAAAGQTVANTTLVGVGDVAPLVTVANHAGSAHVLVDVVGWLRY